MEAVVVIPVFIVLFAGIVYFGNQALAAHAAEAEARTCAWLYSANNCDEVPPGCEGILELASGTGAGDDKGASGGDVKSKLDEAESAGGGIGSIVSSLLKNALHDLFSRSLNANTHRDVQRPTTFGGGTVTTFRKYHLACNLTPREPIDVATDAWNIFRK